MKICQSCGRRFTAENWVCPACGHTPQSISSHHVFAPNPAKPFNGYDERFFPLLASVEAGSFWFESRNRLLIWAIERYFPHLTNFLEIGCGTGFVLSSIQEGIPHLLLSGCDIYTEGLDFAKSRAPAATLIQMDARDMPFEDEFDVIGAFDVIEHIAEDDIVLSQMFRATRRGGGILLTVPQHPFLWSAADDYAHHKRRYTRGELTQKVEAAGFRIIRVTGFVSFLLPLMLLSRVRQRKSTETYDPLEELKLRGLLNTLLGRILAFERSLISMGVSFPLGGSLLIIAKHV